MFSQDQIDQLSDGLKRAALRAMRLPEAEIAAWFINEHDGPQFFTGMPNIPKLNYQPLYLTPAYPDQKPVAAIASERNLIATIENKHMYRDDIVWKPLYLAR